MNARLTSIQTFYDIYPTIGKRQESVLKAITVANRPVSNKEIAKYLGKPINEITPRTNELVKLGFVKIGYKRKCKLSKRLAIHWKLK